MRQKIPLGLQISKGLRRGGRYRLLEVREARQSRRRVKVANETNLPARVEDRAEGITKSAAPRRGIPEVSDGNTSPSGVFRK
jgi:hypothetical protein